MLADVMLFQSTAAVAQSGSGSSYALAALGLILTSGAGAWFWRSGIDVVRAKDKAFEAHGMAIQNGKDIAALETQAGRNEADVLSITRLVADLTTRLENVTGQTQLEMQSLQRQFSKVDGQLEQILSRMGSLDQVGQFIESVNNTKEQLQRMQQLLEQNHVPRKEIEVRFQLFDQRIDQITDNMDHVLRTQSAS